MSHLLRGQAGALDSAHSRPVTSLRSRVRISLISSISLAQHQLYSTACRATGDMAAPEAVDAAFTAAREGNAGEVARLLDADPGLLGDTTHA